MEALLTNILVQIGLRLIQDEEFLSDFLGLEAIIEEYAPELAAALIAKSLCTLNSAGMMPSWASDMLAEGKYDIEVLCGEVVIQTEFEQPLAELYEKASAELEISTEEFIEDVGQDGYGIGVLEWNGELRDTIIQQVPTTGMSAWRRRCCRST